MSTKLKGCVKNSASFLKFYLDKVFVGHYNIITKGGMKMKIIKAIANYGVLAHENETVYTLYGSHQYSDVSEEVEVCIPEEFVVFKNDLGQYLVDVPTGEKFLLQEVLGCKNGNPAICWYSGIKYHEIVLEARGV